MLKFNFWTEKSRERHIFICIRSKNTYSKGEFKTIRIEAENYTCMDILNRERYFTNFSK